MVDFSTIRMNAEHKPERSCAKRDSFWPFSNVQIVSVEARRFAPVFVKESPINNGAKESNTAS